MNIKNKKKTVLVALIALILIVVGFVFFINNTKEDREDAKMMKELITELKKSKTIKLQTSKVSYSLEDKEKAKFIEMLEGVSIKRKHSALKCIPRFNYHFGDFEINIYCDEELQISGVDGWYGSYDIDKTVLKELSRFSKEIEDRVKGDKTD